MDGAFLKTTSLLSSFYKISAEHGDERGQVSLGLLYLGGLGVLSNDEIAREWFRLAAEQGDPDGQFFLGMMYCKGLGFSESSSNNVFRLRYLPYTYMWLSLAASQGDERADIVRGFVEEDMSPSQLQKAKELVDESVNSTD